MVIFSCRHMGALWQACALRFTRYKEEQVVLLASSVLTNSEYADLLVNNNVFEKILPDSSPVKGRCNSEEELQGIITEHYDKLFKVNGISLGDVTDFFLWADVENLFSIYLSINGRKHTLVELSLGQFKKDSRYEGNSYFLGYEAPYASLHRKYYALNGEGGTLISRIMIGQDDVRINDKDEFFNFSNNFLNISANEKQAILRSFKIDNLVDEHAKIFLLNSYAYSIIHSEKRYTPPEQNINTFF